MTQEGALLGHISFGVTDLARATAFYDAALGPLGVVRVDSGDAFAGYGRPGSGDRFSLKRRDGVAPPGAGFHLAFDAPNRAAVDAFHAAAMGQGGTDNGPPGLRPHYGPRYYAAFVIDRDGYPIEAVYQGAE